MEYPDSRADAVARGADHYFTGKPCIRGHVALRKTKGSCVECLKQDWAADNERRKKLPKSEASKAAGRRYYERNRDAMIAKAAAQPQESKRARQRRYAQKYPERERVKTNMRRRRHRQATPPWLSKEQVAQIRQIYRSAQELTAATGVLYEVDHFVPLASEVVCGLHVPWNLQVVPREINRRKTNKHLV